MRISRVVQIPKFLVLIAIAALGPWVLSTAAHAQAPILSVPGVFSDFDGDQHVDQARLFSRGSYKQIHVHLQKSSPKTLSFDSGNSDPGSLLSTDVDRDGDADLIWVSQTSSPMLVFWMGDGRGNFTFISDPQTQVRLRQEFLYGSTGWSAVDDSNRDGPDGVVPRENFITLGKGAIYNPVLISREDVGRSNKAWLVSSPFFSVLHKRGPPAFGRQ